MRALSRKHALALSALIAVAAAGVAVKAARQADDSPQPWAAGRCYRVTIIYPEQQHTLRILEAPRGAWVRVQSDPISPSVPGASTRRPVWLNTASVFTLQEIECSTLPRE